MDNIGGVGVYKSRLTQILGELVRCHSAILRKKAALDPYSLTDNEGQVY